MRQKINLITLGVKDLKKALSFYEKGLGWTKLSASIEELPLFSLGGIIFSLYQWDKFAEDANTDTGGSGFPGITLSLNAKSETEVNTVIMEAEKAGAEILKPAQKAFWGGYHGYFKDLDGHIFEVAYNPFWKLDENDNIKLS